MSVFKSVLKSARKSEKLSISLQLSPAMFWIVFFCLIPVSILVIYSFWDMVGTRLIPVWDLRNYTDVFTRSGGMYLRLLLKSLAMSALVTVGSIALAYPVAYFVSLRIEKYKYTWLILLMGPYFVSWVILVFGWRLVIGYSGLLNHLAQLLGLISEPMSWMWNNWWTVVFLLIMGWSPWLVFPLFVSLEKIDKSLLEAAADLGANPVKRFLRITLPLSSPGLLVATFFVLIPVLGEFVTPVLAGGSKGVMYGNAIDASFTSMMAWPFGSALSMFLMIISLVIATMLIRLISLEKLMESL